MICHLGEKTLELASQIMEGSNWATTASWAADPGFHRRLSYCDKYFIISID